MHRAGLLLLLGLGCLLSSSGCAGFWEHRSREIEKREQRAVAERSDSWLDSNWKAGYGFNNPNAERIRQGLEPQSFDGSVDSDDEDDGFFESMVSNFLGDMITYGIKSTFVASRDLWNRAIQR